MKDSEKTAGQTLTGIKALMMECSIALDNIQDVGLQQTGQLEILTEKVMGLSSDVERLHASLLITKGTTRPPSMRPVVFAFIMLLAAIGGFSTFCFIVETMRPMVESWR